MTKWTITGDDLVELGYPQGKAIGSAIRIVEEHLQNGEREEVLAMLLKVFQYPENFLDDAVLAPVANELVIQPKLVDGIPETPLKEKGEDYAIYGKAYIEPGATAQMEVAMKLPVTVAGALMPDAHQGYGLPIGGVLATHNAVIPYGVGVDIGCRMALSIYDIPESHFYENEARYKRELIAWTKFGAGAGWQGKYRAEHGILDRAEFNATPFIKNLHDKAVHQLGTSGGGNHFVEWGIMEFEKDDAQLNIPKGRYVALLSHSGSRGFGATLAGHYTKLAKDLCKLPDAAKNLAYLSLDSAEGQED